MHLSNQLEAARVAQGLTQEALGERTGVSRMTVVRIEIGKTDPKISTVEALARALGMELMLVPRELRSELDAFIQSGGKMLGQPAGASAPPSVVDELLAVRSKD